MENKRKPRIAVMGAKGFPAWGGAARANEEIFSRLNEKYNITIYAISSHAKEQYYNRMRQIIFRTSENKKITTFLYYIKSLCHSLTKGNYDIVHINHRSAGFIIPFLKLRFPVVFNLRGLAYKDDDKWKWYEEIFFGLFQNLGVRFSDKIITVQKGSISIINKYNAGNVLFIPNGVNNNLLLVSDRQTIQYDITFSAARIIYLKGLHLLLSALSNMKFKGKIQIIGDINQVSTYKDEIIELAKGMDCDFTGIIKDKKELFNRISQSRVFVFPSYSEGMSNMLLEVASLKVPIIASDIPQNTEVFEDREMLFFKKGDMEDLGEKIRWSIKNYNKMLTKADCAYQKVLKNHDWDNIAKQYDNIYQKLLKS